MTSELGSETSRVTSMRNRIRNTGNDSCGIPSGKLEVETVQQRQNNASLQQHLESVRWGLLILSPLCSEPEFLTFKDIRHQFQRIISLWGINSILKFILGDVHSLWRNWRFQNYRLCCVWGKDTPIGHQHISNMQTIWKLSAGDEKSIPALKINISCDMADSIPHSFPRLSCCAF